MEDFEIEKSNYKYVHGARVPNVEFINPLEKGDKYYVSDPLSTDLCISVPYWGVQLDIHAINHQLAYPHTPEGKDAAIAHAQAMLGIHPDQPM